MTDGKIIITHDQVLEAITNGERADPPKRITLNDIAEEYAALHPEWKGAGRYVRRAEHIKRYIEVTELKNLLQAMVERGTVDRLRGTDLADPPYGYSPSAWYYLTGIGMEQERADKARIRHAQMHRRARERATVELADLHRGEFDALTDKFLGEELQRP